MCLQYGISQNLPPHLQREAVGAKRKADRMFNHNGQNLHSFFHSDRETHHIKGISRARMSADQKHQLSFTQEYVNGHDQPWVPPPNFFDAHYPPLPRHIIQKHQSMYRAQVAPPSFPNRLPNYHHNVFPQPSPPVPQQQHAHFMPFIINGKTSMPSTSSANTNGRRSSGDHSTNGTTLPIVAGRPSLPKSAPTIQLPVVEKIKYPIEDLENKPRSSVPPRPPLKRISEVYPNISEDRVGDMLFVWTTVNMQKELFQLDNFTLDDMIEALSLTSLDVHCELLVELHCAILKKLVDNEGDFTIDPSWGFDVEEEEDSSASRVSTKSPSAPPPELAPPAKSTRSSLAKAGIPLKEVKEKTPSPPPPAHRADDLFSEYDWIERLKERDFADGGWQMMLAGFLYEVLNNESPQNRFKDRCEQIISHLIPYSVEPTVDTVVEHFASMDFNLRVSALNIAVFFVSQTAEFRATIMNYPSVIERLRAEKVVLNRQKLQL